MKQLSVLLLMLFFVFPSMAQDRLAITHGPWLQHLTDDEVTIVWTTNTNAVSWVELAPDDGTHFYLKERPKFFSAEYGFKDVGRMHSVRLSGLKPATKYRYRIYSTEVLKHEGTNVQYGTTASTSVYQRKPLEFTTVNPQQEKVSFLIVNDIHGRNDLLENLLQKGEYKSSDFIFFNGDMVNDIRNEEQLFSDFLDTSIRLFASEKPIYYARGNHETRGNFANEFPRYFPSPSNKLYYLLRQGPVCFVVLDCGEDKPDSDIEYSGIVAFDQYRALQLEWLREAVKHPAFTEAPMKVAVIHMPPFGGWYGEEQVKDMYIPVLNEAGIQVMFCGHLHRHVFQQPQGAFKFPVVANTNTSVIRAEASAEGMQVKIINEKGEVSASFEISPK